jgi:hypothetical protein
VEFALAVGLLPPNGCRVVFDLINIFRYDEEGRLAEEWVQTDNRSRLPQWALKAAEQCSTKVLSTSTPSSLELVTSDLVS